MKALAEKQAGGEMPIALPAQTGANQFANLVTGLSKLCDKVAGFCLAAVMLLVVTNIILRVLFNRPLLGTVEYVGFLAATTIGLALAFCAAQNAHIAVNFIVERFPGKIRLAVDVLMNTVAFAFWSMAAWQIWIYAGSLAASGVVSPTTQTPFYPFVYLVSFGLFALCLVLFARIIDLVKRTQLINE